MADSYGTTLSLTNIGFKFDRIDSFSEENRSHWVLGDTVRTVRVLDLRERAGMFFSPLLES